MNLGFSIENLAYEIVDYIHGTDFNHITVENAELVNDGNVLKIEFHISTSRSYEDKVLELSMWEILSWLACREPKEDDLREF